MIVEKNLSMNAAMALQYFLDFLEEGGTPDDFIPFHFEEVA